MAKLNRERRLAERRLEKQARKEARKRESANAAGSPGDTLTSDEGESGGQGAQAIHP